MADEPTATAETDASGTSTVVEQNDALGDAGKKALDQERKNARQAARERDALAARLKEFEDRDKSEAQKLIERAEAAERRTVELETRALRAEVAAEKGLTPAQAKRLSGTTLEELQADADDLLAMFKPTDERDAVASSLDLGVRGSAAPATGGPAADFAKFLGGQTGR